jgi:hypothetical protein
MGKLSNGFWRWVGRSEKEMRILAFDDTCSAHLLLDNATKNTPRHRWMMKMSQRANQVMLRRSVGPTSLHTSTV